MQAASISSLGTGEFVATVQIDTAGSYELQANFLPLAGSSIPFAQASLQTISAGKIFHQFIWKYDLSKIWRLGM